MSDQQDYTPEPTENANGEPANEVHGESAPKEKPVEQPVHLSMEHVIPPLNVTGFSSPFTMPLPEGPLRRKPIPVAMSNATREELNESLVEFSQRAVKDNDEQTGEALIEERVKEQQYNNVGNFFDNEFSQIFERPDSEFTQRVDTEKGPVSIVNQSVNVTSGVSLTGPTAVLALQNIMGSGKPTKIPLWSSGINITVGGFKESEVLNLSFSLLQKHTDIGYETAGNIFTTGDVNIVSDIVDFILSHAMSCNIRGWIKGDIDTLKDLILVSDIPALLTGGLTAIYPSGYPALHSCKNEGTEKCDYKPQIKQDEAGIEYLVDSLMDFKRTLWVDTTRISKSMRQHMSAKDNTYTVEQIQAYQTQADPVDGLTETLGNVRLVLKQPTLTVYTDTGRSWVSNVISMVNEVMDGVTSGTREERKRMRDAVIKKHQSVLRLQRYAAWISAIQFGDFSDPDGEVSIIDNRETIFASLETLASERELADRIGKKVNRYRADVQTSFNGIPNFKCPSCGETQVDPEDTKHSLIPINMVNYFFITTVWRWEQRGTT